MEVKKVTTARQMLDLIDSFFVEGINATDTQEGRLLRSESEKLASILSALRGPDTDTNGLKMRTTVHIRKAAFPRMASESQFGERSFPVWITWPLEEKPRILRDDHLECGSHFIGHVEVALTFLGMEWDIE